MLYVSMLYELIFRSAEFLVRLLGAVLTCIFIYPRSDSMAINYKTFSDFKRRKFSQKFSLHVRHSYLEI